MSDLLIVESPAKAKTIKKYLGSGFEVVASMGHVRDLPAQKMNVNLRKNFEPNYEIIQGKEPLVEKLKKLAKKSKNIFLATDPDREGEAISWHLAYILGLDLENKNRVTFNEITKSGVKKGMKEARSIDLNLVDAQQARRILDRIVGYKLSPFLSGKIRKGLSAGRVQSVAMRVIVDREDEINNFVPVESWSIDGKFGAASTKKIFSAYLWGNKDGKFTINTEQEAQAILEELKNVKFSVLSVKKGTKKRSPAPPFITSTLQQEASRKLGFTAKKTMKIAQELYEGIEVQNMGAVGLITYMRTDSLRLSEEALNTTKEYIDKTWGKEYLPTKPRRFKTKSNAQDAHEAIRPTMPQLSPSDVRVSLSLDQYKIYKLIWERLIASQMADCLLNTTQSEIGANNYIFKASGFIVKFNGFTVLYEEGNDDSKNEEKAKELPALNKDDILTVKELIKNQHFTEPPPRFTEASLIKTLEEYGVGRPSTYASIISTIMQREYVIKENKILKPTELGQVTTNLMKEKFPNIVNIKFTAKMESDLDTIEDGKIEWINILHDFYSELKETLKKATEEMKGVKIQLEEDKTDEICEKCGRNMVIKTSRYGKFLACSGYPECKNIKKLNAQGESVEPVVEESDEICEKCGRKMVIKTGRYGKFLACPGYPECKNIKSIENETGALCPKCGGKLVERRNKRGKIFYGCSKYPECKFITNDKPLEEKCPKCGNNLFKKSGKKEKIYCLAENCGWEKKE